MHYCNTCKKEKNICTPKPCGCPIPDLSSDCVVYTGEPLTCSGIAVPDTLTQIIYKLDKFICEKFNSGLIGRIVNIGTGARLFKQITATGQQELRTLTSIDQSVTIVENQNTIDFSAVIPRIPIHEYQSANNSVDITLVEPDVYNFSVTFPQSDVLETSTSSPSFIKNKNSNKTVTGNYTILPTDNNKVIVADATSQNIIITVPPSIPQNNFFVGFIQKGTDFSVTFVGQDITPENLEPEIYGQGHNAAIEVIDGTAFLFGSLKETV